MNTRENVWYSELETEIHAALDDIKDPCSVAASVPMGLGEMGLVKAVEITGEGHVSIEFRLTSPFCEMIAYFKNEAIAKVGRIRNVSSVSVTHDSGLDWTPDFIAPAARARRQRRLDQLHGLAVRNGKDPLYPADRQ